MGLTLTITRASDHQELAQTDLSYQNTILASVLRTYFEVLSRREEDRLQGQYLISHDNFETFTERFTYLVGLWVDYAKDWVRFNGDERLCRQQPGPLNFRDKDQELRTLLERESNTEKVQNTLDRAYAQLHDLSDVRITFL
jgi:hypothetical protein